ncbi:glycosyltransferase family 4 protein [Roseovarius sp. EL26]|uniref:glycosyltransferase family 4 protein n=1 Tax=Roseovarius sp. EL26 TaxID=2126672 RepID=UPI000EA1E014|nr:glycosyltransferase family 4 protein [Roseovarius sp. EL26]
MTEDISASNSPRRPKVLIIAEAANPERVSVPLIGWSLTEALRQVADIHLVTQIRNREAILRAGWIEGQDFTCIDTEAVMIPVTKIAGKLRGGANKGWTTVAAAASLAYPYFEHLIWKKFGADIMQGQYDIVHRVTPVSPTSNSSLAKKCKKHNVPFVLGPLNGGVPWPKEFRQEQVKEREWLSFVRSMYKLNPARQSMLKNTAAILAGSKFTQSEIPQEHSDRVIYLPENALDLSRFSLESKAFKGGPLQACFIGRLVPYKGADMMLEAIVPLLKDNKLIVDIIGDGPEMPHLKEIASQNAIEDHVTFHGWTEHKDVQNIASQSQLLLFPSIREFGGGVVLEAMKMGLVPVICDYAGPGELVNADTGYKIPMGSRQDIIRDFGQVVQDICASPEQLAAKSQAGQAFVMDNFTWSAKARQISEVYKWVLNGGKRPQPFTNG